MEEATSSFLSNELSVKLRHLGGVELISTSNQIWVDFKMSLGNVCDVLMYLDRSYVKSNALPSIYEMGLRLYRDVLLRSKENGMSDCLATAALDLIAKEREGLC